MMVATRSSVNTYPFTFPLHFFRRLFSLKLISIDKCNRPLGSFPPCGGRACPERSRRVRMGGMKKANARQLRRKSTKAERQLWRHLRLRQLGGHKFRRQQPIGPYIVDFVCLEKRLAIEVDGGQHAAQIADDKQRSAWLKAQGFVVVRFWNNEILREIEGVKEVIWKALGCDLDTPPNLSPPQGERK